MFTTAKHETYKENKKYQLAIRLSVLVFIIFSILTIAQLNSSIHNIVMMSTVSVISILSLVYVYKTKNYSPVFYLISASGVILPSLSIMFFHELTHLAEWVWICCAILLAFLGTNIYYGFVLVFVSILSSLYFTSFSMNANINIVAERSSIQILAISIEFIGAFGSCAYLLYLFHDFYTRSEKALMEINTDLLQKNEQITQQDEEKTILVKEIHHRVKNNLQIITSLLRMQSHEVQNDGSKKQFNDAINRVMAMSLIHQKLYQENTLAQIELKSYLNNLVDELLNVYNIEGKVISTLNVNIKEVGLKSIVPIGLLLNELVSNSLEHGMDKISQCVISIEIEENKDNIILKYSDNGQWKINPEKQSFGLELIDLLTEQLEGNKKLTRTEEGTFYKFTLKNLDH